jgi:hypothetical protein
MSVLKAPLDPATVVVAVDPGKVMNRVWVSDGTGWLEQPMSVPVSCAGVEQVQRLLDAHQSAVAPVIAIEATGSLHQAFVADLERRFPGSTRLFAPSETKAARSQLGSARFKTDDRDCAALTYLARQGEGRRHAYEASIDTLRAAVRHRRGLVADRKIAQQRLHDQLNALCPGLSAPAGARTGAADRDLDCSGGLVLRGRLWRTAADCAVADCSRTWTDDRRERRLLGPAVEGVPAATAGCDATCTPVGPRSAALPAAARRHREPRARDRDPSRVERWTGPDQPAWGRGQPCGRVRSPQFADCPLPRCRASVLRHRVGAGDVSVGQHHSSRSDLSPRFGRAPRRVDGHRLGSVDVLARLRRTRRRVPGPWQEPDPGPGRERPPRLPTRIPAPQDPTTFRRRALSSRKAQPRTVTATLAMPLDGAT